MKLLNKKIRQLESKENDSTAISRAASDKAAELIKTLSGVEDKISKKIIDNFIVFTNSSGGTGASTLAHNVAYTASQKGLKVVLIDFNITCPIQHAYLGIRQEIDKPDLAGYLLGKNSLSDGIDTTNEINLLFSNNRTLMDEINCNNKIAIENLNDMIQKLRQYYDLVIADCPMRIDTLLHNTVLYSCDSIYVVWDEGISSIVNTEKLRRNMALSGIDSFTKMRLILNKRTSIHFSDYSIKKLNIELVEVLPFSIDVIDNSLRGKIFCEKASTSEKNANEFARKVQVLTDKILRISGYVE